MIDILQKAAAKRKLKKKKEKRKYKEGEETSDKKRRRSEKKKRASRRKKRRVSLFCETVRKLIKCPKFDCDRKNVFTDVQPVFKTNLSMS